MTQATVSRRSPTVAELRTWRAFVETADELRAVLAMGWERSRLSHHLGRMEGRGLVRRDLCATDSRGAEILLTAEGADAFRQANGPHLHAVREFFIDALTPAQVIAAGEIAEALRARLAAR
jgi:DNA-binding MarR family transcriptional regulator